MILLSNITKSTFYSYLNKSKLLHFYPNKYNSRFNIINIINKRKSIWDIVSFFANLNSKN